MTVRDTSINQRGLMRCCIATILNYVDRNADKEVPEDFTLIMDCQYEKQGNMNITLKNGVWEWSNAK